MIAQDSRLGCLGLGFVSVGVDVAAAFAVALTAVGAWCAAAVFDTAGPFDTLGEERQMIGDYVVPDTKVFLTIVDALTRLDLSVEACRYFDELTFGLEPLDGICNFSTQLFYRSSVDPDLTLEGLILDAEVEQSSKRHLLESSRRVSSNRTTTRRRMVHHRRTAIPASRKLRKLGCECKFRLFGIRRMDDTLDESYHRNNEMLLPFEGVGFEVTTLEDFESELSVLY